MSRTCISYVARLVCTPRGEAAVRREAKRLRLSVWQVIDVTPPALLVTCRSVRTRERLKGMQAL